MLLAAISLLSILTILPYFYFAVFLFCGITEIWGCNVPLVWDACLADSSESGAAFWLASPMLAPSVLVGSGLLVIREEIGDYLM